MMILEIKIENHPVIGNLVLDFRDTEGNPSNVVILAGENGTGKSAVLELIATLYRFEFIRERSPEIITLRIRMAPEETEALQTEIVAFGQRVFGSPQPQLAGVLNPEMDLIFDRRKAETWDQFVLNLIFDEKTFKLRGDFFATNEAKRHFKAIYSSAEINFEHHQINAVTTQDIDREYSSAITSSGNLATQITQLLIDVQALDDSSLATWVRDNPGKAPPPEASDVRMARFKRAFDYMFPSKRYIGVSNKVNDKEVRFSEGSRTMTINKLSSGEKQIVFRGSFLLKDRSSLKHCVALIDEPEISLHPNWQMKIISFYRKIFEDSNKAQTAQLIFATHSPFVIHNTVDEKIIVLEKGDDGFPRIAITPSFPGYATSAIIEKAFNIEYILPKINRNTIVLVEGPSDKLILDAAWLKRRNYECPYEIVDALCASHIRALFNRGDMFGKQANKIFIGLFDFDNAFVEWKSVKWKELETDETKGLATKHPTKKGIALLLPVPPHRVSYANRNLGGRSTLSIEFIFSDTDIPEKYIGERQIAQAAVKERYFHDSMKLEFANLVQQWPAEKFQPFETLLQVLERFSSPPSTRSLRHSVARGR